MFDGRALGQAMKRRSAWFIGPKGAPLGERLLAVVTALVVLYGLFLRARGYLWAPPALWLDECSWAMNLVEQPLLELCIRPIGFMFLSRLFANAFSLTEPVLRFMPWLAGVATVLMAPRLSRRLFESSAARLLFVFVIALHPCAIDFSKEFKPYSISLSLHLALVFLTLRYLETGLTRDLGWLLGAAVLGGLFAQDLVFAYPGVFLLIGWPALRSRRAHLRPILIAVAVILVLLLAQYFFSWRVVSTTDDAHNWGEKYNVFFTRERSHSYGRWWLARHEDMAGFPGFRRKFWRPGLFHTRRLDELRQIDFAVWCVLHVLGLAVLAFKRQARSLLLVLPIVTLWIFNTLHFWPVGSFRANLFVIGYMTAIACAAFDFAARVRPRIVDTIPALLLVLTPFVLLDPAKSNHKMALTYASEFPKAIKTILQVKMATDAATREPLLLDRRACDPYRYYTEFHPSASRRLRRLLRAQFDVKCVTDDANYRRLLLSAMPRAPHHVWTMLHAPREVLRMVHRRQLGDAELTYEEHIGEHSVMAFWHPPRTGVAPAVLPTPAPQSVSSVAPAAPAPAGTPAAGVSPEEATPEEGAEVPEQAPNSRF